MAYTTGTVTDDQGNQHLQLGGYTKTDGSTQKMADVWFAVDAARTVDRDLVSVSTEIAALPDLAGMGNLRSQHQTMARDTSGQLQALMTRYADPAATFDQRDALVLDILYHWAGVQDVDPASRAATQIYGNAIGDARKLEFLEELLGREYVGTWCWGESDPNPHGPTAAKLLALFDKVKAQVGATLDLQTVFVHDMHALLQVGGSQLIFHGTAGEDTLLGNSADNFFHGLAGNDVLQGGEGRDTYDFNAGDRQDMVLDLRAVKHDAIRFVAASNDRNWRVPTWRHLDF